MVQAARSGVQNIAEGSLASATSKKTELKLTGVARASLGELLLDFEDYLRQNALRQWKKDDPEAIRARSDRSDKSGWSDWSDEFFANTMICLINQASYLLWKQMQRLEEDFIKDGGFTERLYNVRKTAKDR
jgi:four helix bundle suffix protein